MATTTNSVSQWLVQVNSSSFTSGDLVSRWSALFLSAQKRKWETIGQTQLLFGFSEKRFIREMNNG